MARTESYLVPVDFSRGSEIALKHALKLANHNKATLVLLYVIPTITIYPVEGTTFDLYGVLEREARENFDRLAKRNKLKTGDYRIVLERGANPAEIIAREAKKLKAGMIIMGSHGRTGLQRFMLGSVAEKTLRYADCPVLVVKK